ncbi:MAG: hypothetical protein JWM55_1005 [Acidimicrobiaceae bacterium]|nr:hypothetical protein [Acidimicrobiaceae bacterium]
MIEIDLVRSEDSRHEFDVAGRSLTAMIFDQDDAVGGGVDVLHATASAS